MFFLNSFRAKKSDMCSFNTSLINHYGILSHLIQPMAIWPVCPSDPKTLKPVMIIFILAVGGSILIILAKMCSASLKVIYSKITLGMKE